MTDLQGQICYWESIIHDFSFFMPPATQALITGTIKSLKELQKLKRGE